MRDADRNDAQERSKGQSYLYLAVLVACTGGFIFGFASFVITGVIIFLTKRFSLSPAGVGFAITSMMFGCLIGASVAGGISDRLGRKRTMMAAAILWAISSLGSALAPDMAVINLFRICGGLGVGIVMLVSPIYIAEISPPRLRGRLSTANQFIIVSGALAAFLVSYAFSFSESWRWTFSTGVLPAFFLFGGLFLVPESPRWLVERNRQSDAFAVLTKICGRPEATSTLKEIVGSLTGEKGRFSDLFHRGARGAVVVGVGIAAFQQLTGSAMVAFYAPVIFQKAGFRNPSTAIGLSVLVFLFNLVCVVIAYGLVDRVGRKPLLLFGAVGMGVGQVVLALILSLTWPPAYAVLAVLMIQAVSNVSWSPLGWVILGEIFPTRIRAKAMAIATIVLWASMIASVQVFPSIGAYFDRKLGSVGPAFLVFAGLCVAAYIFVWRMLPETKGRTLEEIADFWVAT